ncbi:ABC transporter permease [Clostridioides mangenotii]|uniref:ABC transporter permease n=1 Tax=Metaclostridioides mangenotii TaxID=1540 RepID=UPI001C11BE62|nr:ABC transporter permease [Clostridioides mangenotii]MBU5306951.1 ABC transporter permease [Clostridioides mangenotii]
MLQNNNQSIVNKLTKKILTENKMRNVFAVMAIALTTLMITSAITAGTTLYSTSQKYQTISTYGIDSDGYILGNRELDNLKSHKDIKKVGIEQSASDDKLKNKELLNEGVYLEAGSDQNVMDIMSIVPIEGDLPNSSNEVFMPTWVLDILGIDKKVGEDVELDVVLGGKVKNIKFKLSGYYESLVPRGTGRTRVFVSSEFIDKYNKSIIKEKNSRSAFVILKNVDKNTSYKEVQKKLEKIAKDIGVTKYKAHPKYDDSRVSSSDKMTFTVAVIIGLLLVIFTGYLIIYNIFYISVNKDIRLYGLLKTIGTTSKQLQQIIRKQALTLSIIGIPIGLLLGYLLSKVLVPLAFKFTIFGNIVVVKPNIYVFLASIVFSLSTVFISCRKPGKIAGRVSPIEAVRYLSEDLGLKKSKRDSKKGIHGAKIYKMAWSNLLKSRKRAILSILSISLSALIVVFTINGSLGMDPKKHADKQMNYDISITNNDFYNTEKFVPVTQNFINDIKLLNFVDEVELVHEAIVPNVGGKIYSFGVDIVLDGVLKNEIDNNRDIDGYKGYNEYFKSEERNPKEKSDFINTSVQSIENDKLDEKLKGAKVLDGKIDILDFTDDDSLIYYTKTGKSKFIKAGKKLPLTFIMRDTKGNVEKVTKEFNVVAVVEDGEKDENAVGLDISMFNINEKTFKSIFKNYEDSISRININLKENENLKYADKTIEKLVLDTGNSSLKYLSKNYYINALQEFKLIAMIIGISISAVLGLIGAINIINTVFTGIFARRVEFAMLESIGMTKKQLKEMVLFEGVYYILFSMLIILPFGAFIAYLAPMVLPIYGGFNFKLYIISVSICLMVITILMLSVPVIGYKMVSKDSIVDRLRISD